MTEQPETRDGQLAPAAADGPAPVAASPEGHPEIAVGASFAGGLLLALILKRLAR